MSIDHLFPLMIANALAGTEGYGAPPKRKSVSNKVKAHKKSLRKIKKQSRKRNRKK